MINFERFMLKLELVSGVYIDDENKKFEERVRKRIGCYIMNEFDLYIELVELNKNLCSSIYDYEIVKYKTIELIADNVTYRVLRHYGIVADKYHNTSYLEVSSYFSGDNAKVAKRKIVEFSNEIIDEIDL